MTSVTVNIVGGSERENTTAVTIGAVRWGLNGTAPLGSAQIMAEGTWALTVYKTSVPTQIGITVEVYGNVALVNITVNLNDISVN
ncbi:hypothetical protein RT97_00515 [Variovorax paradoxus]|uniref:Uncharacterized protein n=1 Tax=Variovorax paradoxus TaxID=34073 RepID=A0A0D0N700_VARPD|nr:hypothetical protein [Variovorax paradoxus]KIQ37150.1 hypothetical protein RT97_00515 [Variovorax paradoxus]